MMRGGRISLVLMTALLVAACQAEEERGWLGYAEGEEAFVAPPQP
ncbi:MAG: hypothetical protein RJB62_1043, partial [Pseudomonadota bacterium]